MHGCAARAPTGHPFWVIAEDVRVLPTADGVRLRAGLRSPAEPRRWAVLCHAHPDYGGSMKNTLIAALSHGLADDGMAALRFDFRRPGTVAERRRDVEAALDLAEPGGALLVGWSYGADIALAVAARDDRVAGVVAIAPPLMAIAPEEMEPLAELRALVLVPQFDQFNPPGAARDRLPGIDLEVVEASDHFCDGAEDEIVKRVVDFERSLRQ